MKTTLKLMKLMIKLAKMISGDRIDQVVLFDEVQPLAYDILHDMAGNESSRHQLLARELPWAFKLELHSTIYPDDTVVTRNLTKAQ